MRNSEINTRSKTNSKQQSSKALSREAVQSFEVGVHTLRMFGFGKAEKHIRTDQHPQGNEYPNLSRRYIVSVKERFD